MAGKLFFLSSSQSFEKSIFFSFHSSILQIISSKFHFHSSVFKINCTFQPKIQEKEAAIMGGRNNLQVQINQQTQMKINEMADRVNQRQVILDPFQNISRLFLKNFHKKSNKTIIV